MNQTATPVTFFGGLTAPGPYEASRRVRAIVYLPLVASTFLAKLAFPPLGAMGMGVVFPLVCLLVIIGVATRDLEFVRNRLVLFLMIFACLAVAQLGRCERCSVPSFGLMGVLGLSFTLRNKLVTSSSAVQVFCDISFVVALMGILQFAAQSVVGLSLAFPIESLVPSGWRTGMFNNITPLHWGSTVYKSNGVVMLEPSEFSQLCAIGFIAQMSVSMRPIRLATLGLGLILSYSGAGLIILVICLPYVVVVQQRWRLMIACIAFVGLAALFAKPLRLDVTLARIAEFDHPGSSGYTRFVGWYGMFKDRLWPDPVASLLGTGAGTFAAAAAGYSAAEMAHSKILFEFGILGAAAYFSFIFYCFFSAPAPAAVRLAVAGAYFLNAAYSSIILGLALSLLLWPTADQGRAARENHR